ncbi:hypothetical protein OPV22_004656 [Ensete ventricosum]|uniref:Uncharacterized protein n=1 Tax=Ensete ventricosum TaxID=4639 RepID=A0AAV8RB48_ENSVE|nr:hypothetical protein OPV22_004656 [Ensete ventricosum]
MPPSFFVSPRLIVPISCDKWECICEKEVCGSENRRRREDHQTGRLGKGGSVAYWPSDDIKEAFGSSLRVRVPPSPTFISAFQDCRRILSL